MLELYISVAIIVSIILPMSIYIWGDEQNFDGFMSTFIFGIMCGIFWPLLIPVGFIMLMGKIFYHTAKGFRTLIRE